MPGWLVIADDLTGACDTGAAFARRGLETVVWLAGGHPPPEDVLVYSTNSRYLDKPQAARKVEEAVRTLPAGPDTRIYKKIDSTLRGHVAAELLAVMRASSLDRALVAPAFPAQQRVVREGRVWVGGLLLEETAFKNEAAGGDLNKVLSGAPGCRLVSLEQVRAGGEILANLLADSDGVTIADAETDEDLLALARAGQAAGLRLWCGSAGLASALAAGLRGSRFTDDHPVVRKPPGPVLVIVGSMHPAALAQAAALETAGAAVYSLAEEDLRAGAGPGQVGRSAADRLNAGKHVVLSCRGLPYLPQAESTVAEALAAAAVYALSAAGEAPARVVLTGGDTAEAFCRLLGCTQIRLVDELSPGLALGVLLDGGAPGLSVVTKAGGFGSRDTLVSVLE